MYDTYSVGMIQSDPPGHTRLRMLLNKVFTPAEVDRLRSRIEVLVGELLDRVQPDGRMDAINDFAYPLPVTVLCEILGVPVDRRDQIGTWTANVNRTVSGTCPLNECADQAQSSVLEMRAYFAELVEQRREQPRDDLLSLLVAAEEAGDKLSMDELQTTVVMLISAGHETTTSLIGNGLLTLLQHPDQLRQLRENPDLMSAAIDEILRYESPLQRQTRRVAEDAEFGGRQIRKGQMVSVLLGAANRDPSVFSDPDRFDIRREDNKHIAFGFGIHSCLGRFLSRLEGTIAFDAILRRFPKLQLETEEIKWQHHVAVRCVESLPVSF
jgi:cytochrome P450